MIKLNEQQKEILKILGVDEKLFRTYESAGESCGLTYMVKLRKPQLAV